MSLAASIIVTSLPLLGGVHMDADAQGRAVLGWEHLRGSRRVVEVVDTQGGRLGPARRLWSSREVAVLEDLDVAASGAAIACIREQPRVSRRWRIRVATRAPGGAWSRPRVVLNTSRLSGGDVECGVSDAGQAVMTWTEGRGRAGRVAELNAAGRVQRRLTFSRDPINEGTVEVAADGSVAVVYSKQDRVLRLAQRSVAGEWSRRAFGPDEGWGPQLAIGAANQPILAWWGESGEPHVVAGPTFAPTPLPPERDRAPDALAAGPGGDVLLVSRTGATRPGPVQPGAPGRLSALAVSIARPGAPFAPATILGPLGAGPVEATVAADGSGAVGWYADSSVALRKLGVDGTWAPPIPITTTMHGELFLAGAPGGTVTAAWTEVQGERGDVVLRLAAF